MPEAPTMLHMLDAANRLLHHWRSASREDCVSAIAFLRVYGDPVERALAEDVEYEMSKSTPENHNGSHNHNGPPPSEQGHSVINRYT